MRVQQDVEKGTVVPFSTQAVFRQPARPRTDVTDFLRFGSEQVILVDRHGVAGHLHRPGGHGEIVGIARSRVLSAGLAVAIDDLSGCRLDRGPPAMVPCPSRQFEEPRVDTNDNVLPVLGPRRANSTLTNSDAISRSHSIPHKATHDRAKRSSEVLRPIVVEPVPARNDDRLDAELAGQPFGHLPEDRQGIARDHQRDGNP